MEIYLKKLNGPFIRKELQIILGHILNLGLISDRTISVKYILMISINFGLALSLKTFFNISKKYRNCIS